MTSGWSCRLAQEHFSAELDAALSPDARGALAAHLDGCDACAKLRLALGQTLEILRALPVPEPGAGLAARAAAAALAAARPRTSSWIALPVAAALALAASAAIVRQLPVGERLDARSRVAGERVLERVEQLAGDLAACRATAGEAAASRLDRLGVRLEALRRWRNRREALSGPAPLGRVAPDPAGSVRTGSRTRGLRAT